MNTIPQTETTVHKSESGQFQTTIPKALADGIGLKDKSKIEWEVTSRNSLKLKVVKSE